MLHLDNGAEIRGRGRIVIESGGWSLTVVGDERKREQEDVMFFIKQTLAF